VRLLLGLLGSLTLLAVASSSRAATATPGNCDLLGCDGSTLTLTASNVVYGSSLSTTPISTSASTGLSGFTAHAGLRPIPGGGDYTQTFQVVGGNVLSTNSWTLVGRYTDTSTWGRRFIWNDGGVAAIPEPSAAVLFGLGAILVTRRTRRVAA
jgi:hypothetical protein